jgi:hypothetical protein
LSLTRNLRSLVSAFSLSNEGSRPV